MKKLVSLAVFLSSLLLVGCATSQGQYAPMPTGVNPATQVFSHTTVPAQVVAICPPGSDLVLIEGRPLCRSCPPNSRWDGRGCRITGGAHGYPPPGYPPGYGTPPPGYGTPGMPPGMSCPPNSRWDGRGCLVTSGAPGGYPPPAYPHGYPQVQTQGVQIPSTCSVEGRPDMQGIRGLTHEECALLAQSAGTKDGASREKRSVTLGTSPNTQVVPLAINNEGTGGGVCRLRSDGSARLKANPSQGTTQGQVLAVSETTADSGPAPVIPKQSGEDCSIWRRRVANELIWRG